MEPRNARRPIPQNSPERLKALHNIGVLKGVSDPDLLAREHTVILSLEGGGFHILWTLQLLKELEREASRGLETPLTCADLFDVVTGTSAGAITAALFLKGWSAAQVEEFWLKGSRHPHRLYPYRNPFVGAFLETLTHLGLNLSEDFFNTVAWYFDAPLFDKKKFREIAAYEFSDERGDPVTMGDLCAYADRGLFLLTKDTKSGYILPIGCVPNPLRDEPGKAPVFGLARSRDLLAGAVLEAATSPPLQMQPLGQYIDAGFGSFNNPVMATITGIDRILLSVTQSENPDHDYQDWKRLDQLHDTQTASLAIKYLRGFYPGQIDSKTAEKYMNTTPPQNGAVFAFGTAFTRDSLMDTWLSRGPLTPGATWINWYILDVIKESTHLQTAFFSSRAILPALDFRNFNMALSRRVLKRIPNRDFGRIPGFRSTTLHDLTDNELYYLTTMLEPAYIPVYRVIGQAVFEYMREQSGESRPLFSSLLNELADYRPNIDVPDLDEHRRNRSAFENELVATLGSREWLERQPTGKSLGSYFRTPLPGFRAPFFQERSPLDVD